MDERRYRCPECGEVCTSSSWTHSTCRGMKFVYPPSEDHWINEWDMDTRSVNDSVVCPMCGEPIESNRIQEVYGV